MKITITLSSGKVLELTKEELDELVGKRETPFFAPTRIPDPYPDYPGTPWYPYTQFWCRT